MKFVSRTLINSNKSKYFTFIVLFVPDSVARFYHGKYKKNIENRMHSTLMSNVFMKRHITTYSGDYTPVGPKIFYYYYGLNVFIGFASAIVAIWLIQSK